MRGLAQQRMAGAGGISLFVVATVVAVFLGDHMALLAVSVFAVTALAALAVMLVWLWLQSHRRRLRRAMLFDIVEAEDSPALVTDERGRIVSQNAAVAEVLGQGDGVDAVFGRIFAHPQAMVLRLQARAGAGQVARETIVTRRGQVRIHVTGTNEGLFLWRIDLAAPATEERSQNSLPMLTAGPSGTILFMNEPFRRLLGGRAKALDQIFGQLPLVSGRVHDLRTESGQMPVLVALMPGSGGRQEVVLLPAVAGAVTARWDAVEDLPVPLMKVARSGEVLTANREARHLLAAPITETTRMSDLLEGLGRPIIDWLEDVASGRAVQAREFLRGKGERQDFFVQVALHPAGEGADRHLIAVLNDMTEFKALEAQFVQSQKMQAIGQLAGGIAHDFNNLLTAISGHCDMLLLRHDQGDPDYGDLSQIHQNANRAAGLVSQLLAFSRKQNLNPEVLDLREILGELTHLLGRLVGERVSVVLSHDPGLDRVRADKRQIEQVIMNLVVNARDAMPSGGEIRIETDNITIADPVERDRATIPPGRYVLVRVIDEGHGIAPEKRRKIFEPFYTTKKAGEGTGLGLSTAYGIVKQTGGFIFVDSEVGEGSVFSVYLPSFLGQEEELPRPENPPLPGGRSNGPREGIVLLVEDEAPVRAFASRALRLRGMTVLEADCGETALAMLADPDLKVDVFVTDVIMPGKDGPTWVREALQARPSTRVVFVSGYAEDAFAENRALIPNSTFLPKPFSLAELTSRVQAELDAA